MLLFSYYAPFYRFVIPVILAYLTKVNRCSVVIKRMPTQFLNEAHCLLMIISLDFSVSLSF